MLARRSSLHVCRLALHVRNPCGSDTPSRDLPAIGPPPASQVRELSLSTQPLACRPPPPCQGRRREDRAVPIGRACAQRQHRLIVLPAVESTVAACPSPHRNSLSRYRCWRDSSLS